VGTRYPAYGAARSSDGRVLEDLSTCGEYLVQRVLKVRRRISELAADLIDVLFTALLDLLLKQLPQRSVA